MSGDGGDSSGGSGGGHGGGKAAGGARAATGGAGIDSADMLSAAQADGNSDLLDAASSCSSVAVAATVASQDEVAGIPLAGKSAPSTPGHSVAAVHVTPDRSGDALADSNKPSASAAVPAASASCAEAPCSASPIVPPLQLAPDSPGARAAGDAWLDLALAMREQAARGRGVVPPVRDVEKRLLEEVVMARMCDDQLVKVLAAMEEAAAADEVR